MSEITCEAIRRLTRPLERASRAACRRASVAAGNGAASSTSDESESARQAWLSQRRAYRQLRNQKCKSFWSDKVSASINPRDMWSTVDRLLGRGNRACDRVSADELSRFFTEKVERIRSTTTTSASSLPPTYRPVPPGPSFTEFTSVSLDDVAAAIACLPEVICP